GPRRRAALGRAGPAAHGGGLPPGDRRAGGGPGRDVRGTPGGVRPRRAALRALPDAAGVRPLAAGPGAAGRGGGGGRGHARPGPAAPDAAGRGGRRPGRRAALMGREIAAISAGRLLAAWSPNTLTRLKKLSRIPQGWGIDGH